MEIMQKRYHDYQESINKSGTNNDSNRSSMNASPFEVCFEYLISMLFVTKINAKNMFCAKLCFSVSCCVCFFSELTLTIEIKRIDLIHLAQDLDLAAYQISRVILRMAMHKIIKISLILMISQHRMMVHSPIQDHES